jgi:beta-glucosidase
VHTFQAVENGRFLTLAGEEDREVAAVAQAPDGWFVKELWELHPLDGAEQPDPALPGRFALRSNANHSRKYVRVDEGGNLVADAESAHDATPFTLDLLTSGVHEAAAAASAADRAVVVVGNDPHINGRETVDRDGLSLPAQQEALVRAVHAANPNTVLIVVSSYPYTIDWADEHVPAILWTSHGGQELGNAVAEVLAGGCNPAGRVPQTWYSANAELPAPADYDIIGSQWTYQYSRREHLYPFGHGLSYTTFDYSDPVATVTLNDGTFTVTVDATVANTGGVAGEAVAQLYSRALNSPVPTPLRRLQGFERFHLEPGEARTVSFEVPAVRLTHWSEERGGHVGEPGDYEFAVGGSSADLPAAVTVPCWRSAQI